MRDETPLHASLGIGACVPPPELPVRDMVGEKTASALIVGGATLVTVNPAAGWTIFGVGVGLIVDSLAE
jgi:hypothetical protein